MTGGFASRPWLIVPVCAGIHIFYAIALTMNSNIVNITSLDLAGEFFARGALVFLLLLSAIVALIPMVRRMHAADIHYCLWPQQMMLFLCVGSIFWTAAASDTPLFVVADNVPTVALMAGHLAASIRNLFLGMAGDGLVR